MALYIKFVSHAPSLPNISIDYPYVRVEVAAYTTADFQGGTEIGSWTVDVVTFTGTTPRTGNVYTAFGDVPDGRYGAAHYPTQVIDGPLSYDTAYNFRAYVEGHSVAEGAGNATSDLYDFTTEGPPGLPTNPVPANNDTSVDFSGFTLSWTAGGYTDTYNIYIGPLGSLVEVSHEQVDTSYITNIDEVPYNQKIYWRVDATNDIGTTEGTVWNFDARPGKVATTIPVDEAADIHLSDTTGSWESPSNTDSYRVLYGTLSGFLSEVGTTTDLSMVLVEGNFSVYGKISYWRVDAVNVFGTTAGDELYFTTMVFAPVLPTGVTLDHSGGEGGVPTGTATGENNMITLRKLVAVANSKIWIEDI